MTPIVIGLGFGDEGKGSVVDFLVRHLSVGRVVRFNGGPQAAHHVVTPEGRTHCFAQLGAGTLAGAETVLRAPMAIDPLALHAELDVLDADPDRVWVDPDCVVVTPWHARVNQLREQARGTTRHGSCGRGVGEAILDAERPGLPTLRMGDLTEPRHLRRQLRLVRLAKLDHAQQLGGGGEAEWGRDVEEHVADRFHRLAGSVRTRLPEVAPAVWEGAQGVLLDRDHGFFPHVTPSHTTFAPALRHVDDPVRVGVLRTWHTRHGAGPLPSEDAALAARLPELHNPDHPWQGPMRAGSFDLVLARYALAVCGGVDLLVLTQADRLAAGPVCVAWEVDGRVVHRIDRADTELARRARPVLEHTDDLVGRIDAELGPVHLVSHGTTAEQKHWR